MNKNFLLMGLFLVGLLLLPAVYAQEDISEEDEPLGVEFDSLCESIISLSKISVGDSLPGFLPFRNDLINIYDFSDEEVGHIMISGGLVESFDCSVVDEPSIIARIVSSDVVDVIFNSEKPLRTLNEQLGEGVLIEGTGFVSNAKVGLSRMMIRVANFFIWANVFMDSFELIKKDILDANISLSKGNNLVFGRGNSGAKIFFVGEAPGKKEDELGLPFVGSSGKLLDKLLVEAGIGLDSFYVANVLKFRPPNNRNPKREEIDEHTPFLVRQINCVNPSVVCCLGNYATNFVLSYFGLIDEPVNISNVHGTFFKHQDFVVIPLFHPAALIYNRKLLDLARADLLKVKDFFVS